MKNNIMLYNYRTNEYTIKKIDFVIDKYNLQQTYIINIIDKHEYDVKAVIRIYDNDMVFNAIDIMVWHLFEIGHTSFGTARISIKDYKKDYIIKQLTNNFNIKNYDDFNCNDKEQVIKIIYDNMIQYIYNDFYTDIKHNYGL